jgi:hypothetical protein
MKTKLRREVQPAIAGKPFGVIKRGWQRNPGHASVNGKIIYEWRFSIAVS